MVEGIGLIGPILSIGLIGRIGPILHRSSETHSP